MQRGYTVGGDETRVRPHEARMEAGVYEPSTFTQNACRVSEEPFEVIHIGMRKCGENCIERSVRKGQVACVGLDEFDLVADTLPREAKLILGHVDAGHRPSEVD